MMNPFTNDPEQFEQEHSSLRKAGGFDPPAGFWDENAANIMSQIEKPKSWLHHGSRIVLRIGLPIAAVSLIWILLLPTVNRIPESMISEQVVLSFLDDEILPGMDEDIIMNEYLSNMPDDTIVKKKSTEVFESNPSMQVPDSLQNVELTEEDILNYLLEEEFE